MSKWTHGWSTNDMRLASGLAQTPEYRIWWGMKNRCFNKNRKEYQRYGAKGVRVCHRWLYGARGTHPFLCFLADVGPRPTPEHSLDRFPKRSGNYTPNNVRWATAKEQGESNRGLKHPHLARLNKLRRGTALTDKHRANIALAMTGKKRGPYKTKGR